MTNAYRAGDLQTGGLIFLRQGIPPLTVEHAAVAPVYNDDLGDNTDTAGQSSLRNLRDWRNKATTT